jgi:hypothetical protein
MKIIVVYTYLVKPSETVEDYTPIHERFLSSYLMFAPKTSHSLVVCGYGGVQFKHSGTQEARNLCYKAHWFPYHGSGFDCGVILHSALTLDCDFLVVCNTQIHFWKSGWLERLVKAFEKHGDGLYGFAGSYENHPHLRTPLLAFPPSLLRKFPYTVHDRVTSHAFENGQDNVTQWVRKQGKPTMMVTWDEVLPQQAWRKPANCFRRGDQSDLLVHDRHSKLWAEVPDLNPYKLKLQRSADGLKTDAP